MKDAQNKEEQNHPLISLVVPAFNEAKYIGKCLESALKNSNGNFGEIIVVDNSSTDNTAEIAETFPGVRVVKEPIRGTNSARQRGYLESKEEIVAFVDADTIIPEGWADFIVKSFEKQPELACLSGPYEYYGISWPAKVLSIFYQTVLSLPIYWIVGYMALGGNMALRRSVLKKMGGINTYIKFYGDDTDIARRASKFGRSRYVLRHTCLSSARRFKSNGLFRTGFHYGINFFWEVIFHRPLTTHHDDVR